MKEIKAYIHKHRIADVDQALKASAHLDGPSSQGLGKWSTLDTLEKVKTTRLSKWQRIESVES